MQEDTQKSQRAGAGGAEDHSQDSVTLVCGNTMVKQEASGITIRVR